jgi:hypothetical protein
LEQGMIPARGWSYFLDDGAAYPELLPTAYAVRALAMHRFENRLREPINYLMEQLQSPASRQSDASVRVACVFILAFLPPGPGRVDEDRLGTALADLWHQLEPLLSQAVEANIEYSHRDLNYYVRVPWQLYLISAAARLKPLQCFASALAQNRLSSIVGAVTRQGGFIYPHSGDRLSVRTNGILYDVLSLIREEIKPRRPLLTPFYYWDNVRLFLGSRIVRAVTVAAVSALIVVGIWQWRMTPNASLADLGPEFVSSLLLLILSSRKEV